MPVCVCVCVVFKISSVSDASQSLNPQTPQAKATPQPACPILCPGPLSGTSAWSSLAAPAAATAAIATCRRRLTPKFAHCRWQRCFYELVVAAAVIALTAREETKHTQTHTLVSVSMCVWSPRIPSCCRSASCTQISALHSIRNSFQQLKCD